MHKLVLRAAQKDKRLCAIAGWMSNRGRQNVASYLALDVGANWRQGAEWFQALLVDHDVCSNWGNWVCAAGLGGSRGGRFDVLKQSRVYICYITTTPQHICTHTPTHSCSHLNTHVCAVCKSQHHPSA